MITPGGYIFFKQSTLIHKKASLMKAKPPLKIIGSYTSPFVRTVRVACEELDLAYEMDVTTFFARNTAEQEDHVKLNNPLMRVPVLIDGTDTIVDSRIIVNHLIKQYGSGKDFAANFPLSLKQENILTTVYGLLESAVLWFILKNTQPGINMQEGYASRSLDRVHSGLEWLDTRRELGQHFGVAEALLICALEWLQKRAVVDWSGYANIVALHKKFTDRESVLRTRIPENA